MMAMMVKKNSWGFGFTILHLLTRSFPNLSTSFNNVLVRILVINTWRRSGYRASALKDERIGDLELRYLVLHVS